MWSEKVLIEWMTSNHPLEASREGCGSEAGSYVRLIDFVYHSSLGLRVIKKKTSPERAGRTRECITAKARWH